MNDSSIAEDIWSVRQTPYGKPTPVDLGFYARYALAGALCCSVTLTPVDLLRNKLEQHPDLYQAGIRSGMRQLMTSNTLSALLTSARYTFGIHFISGGLKFGGYEVMKQFCINGFGDRQTAIQHRTSFYLISYALSAFCTDSVLAPLEATRRKIDARLNFDKAGAPSSSFYL